ncbi:hypothetical protein FNV43_RR01910 [Rhamnella rubrinervis]|uniref:ADP-ribosyl cyclase/cyclic ADP-ribose hydrolase n=1 Tax=Rhamnella rubrinervis TaxID=2594499 RepID=A0A8K0MTE4_9ROSA|nr:hypothetical protein FNV43_RR01910 [Rhamnella rubrinervis]
MLQQLKALLFVLFQSPTFYICVISILYLLHAYISDGIRRCWDPRRTERRPPSLDASSSSSTNPEDTPSLDASSSSSTNPEDTPSLDASSSSASNPQASLDASSSSSTNPEDTPSLDTSSSSASNPQDTPSLDAAASSSASNPQDTPSLDAASSSSASNPHDNYDVFLSFTHRDGTWKIFTSHLHKALKRKGIYTFLDAERLEKDEEVSPELDNAIKGSRCAVVVLSKKYASSRWCMDELVQIIKCRKDSKIKQIVLPIFYHVNRDEILEKEMKGPIWEGFQSLKEKFRDNEEKVKSWTDALVQLGNIIGDSAYDSTIEAQFIEDFIEVVSSKLFDPALLNISENLVGMESRLEKLKRCVYGSRSSSGDVRFIGICGLGGVGKTTLAEAYLKYMSGQFQASSFLVNVRETCKMEHDGLVKLQKQLLRDVLKGEHTINNVYEGKCMIRGRLCRKKILVVLDDVDHLNQLRGLAEKSNWFGDGSQIIVTTRDKSLLKSMYGKKEYIIHKVDELEYSEALQLFSSKAIESDCAPEDFRELSEEVIEYASGLPLALVVLGSFLRGKDINQWKCASDRLKEYPEKEILSVLRISFDGLGETEKNIFLDIACFFNGSRKDYVMNIMDRCGFFPEIGIRSLVDKSLLHITEEYDSLMKRERSMLRMHDLLEEMGKEIVREKSRNEPGRRSRIWLVEDFVHVLNNGTGTEEVEAILCPHMRLEEISNWKGFSNMKNLRLLIIRGVEFLPYEGGRCPDIEYLPNELRLLEWEDFPFKSFPRSFQPHGLVELTLKLSNIERLWDNPKMEPLYGLKSIELRYSLSIRKLENFHLFPNLEKLILENCGRLEKIGPSITVLKRLTLLNMRWCSKLKSLPTSMGDLKSFKVLDLTGCSSLGDLPEDFELSDEELCLRDLPEGFVHSAEELDVTGHELQSHGWKNIWNTIAGLSCLEKLYLDGCGLRDGAFPDDFGCLVSLEYLRLSCNEFSCLPAHFNQLSKLRHLDLNACQNLTSLGPELPDNLESINVDWCPELHTFLDPLSQCNLHCSAIYCGNCFKLVNRQGSERTAITSLGRYLQNHPKPSKRFDIVLPGNEIPSGFTHKAMGSSSISLPLYPNWCSDKWMGFALSVRFSDKIFLDLRDWFWEIKINQEDWGFGHVRWAGEERWDRELYGGGHIWLLYLPRDAYFHSEWHNKKFDHIQFSFKYPCEEEFKKYEECGVRLVYEGDIQELIITARDEPIELPAEDEDVDFDEDEDVDFSQR